eukprot:g3256.t1
MSIILICAGVTIPRNFSVDFLRQGPKIIDDVTGHMYNDYSPTAKVGFASSIASSFGGVSCNDLYSKYIANDSYAMCRGVKSLGENSLKRFPNSDGKIYVNRKASNNPPMCDANLPDADYVGKSSSLNWILDPIDRDLGKKYYRKLPTERNALYFECQYNKLRPFAVLVWCVLYFFAIAGASLAFAFSPRKEKSMILLISVVLLLVTLLSVHIENLQIIRTRNSFRSCGENDIKKENFYSTLPVTKNLVKREDAKCVFSSDDPQYATCSEEMTLIDPDLLEVDCSARTASCVKTEFASDGTTIKPKTQKDWFGDFNQVLNKTIKWDHIDTTSQPEPAYRWCPDCTEGTENSINTWDIVSECEDANCRRSFTRRSGSCEIDGNCIQSPNWPSPYGKSSFCSVNVEQEGLIVVKDFDLQTVKAANGKQDTLEYVVDAVPQVSWEIKIPYIGTSGPNELHVKKNSRFTFSTVNTNPGKGFKICLVPKKMVPTKKPQNVAFHGRGGNSVIEGGTEPGVWYAPIGPK